MHRFCYSIFFLLMLFGLYTACNKPEEIVDSPANQSKEIIIELNAPGPIYENNRRFLMDASSTNLANKKRIYYFWTCTGFPIGSTHRIITPRGAATIVDSIIVGKYTFLLEATDDFGNKARKNLELDVLQDTLAGRPPVILPLTDQSLYLPENQVFLKGETNYQVNPLHRELFFKWSVIQQPTGSPAVFINNPSGANTYASGFAAGIYLFRLELRNEAGFTSSDTMELKVFPDSLNGIIRVYENVPWILEYDDWGSYLSLKIEDGDVFINRNDKNLYVRVWSNDRKEWLDLNRLYWYVENKRLIINNWDYPLEILVGKTAKVEVTFW